ncbi:FAD-binding domain-containing protein [Lindgomyces ingoldianus]|uniref:FAD-binding domain-containing protein n=1 Tax=Lindgomyces ingoldianus TaxID=673940 RepID=A0ACB6RCD1_9PLEO|nr:FAD-binding domain-containing protein [Lindgomyces ingoldianus]KAF2476700.1 FAD-binding domain-containing protein [Lindgomyces ingoldianus]
MERHSVMVQQIQTKIREFYNSKTPYRVYHGSTNSTRHVAFDPDRIVDVSSLNRVLHLDLEKKTALVEPNMPMDALVNETIGVGLLPPVVMEFPGITVGGGFVGTAGESSSFKYGFFDQTVNWVEIVLADGTLAVASSTEHPDLFRGLAGSFGTLGVLTLVELRLIDYKPYVALTYYPTSSIHSAIIKLKDETARSDNDFVDGILFTKVKGAVVSGRLTDSCQQAGKLQRFARPWNPWFYLHARSIADRGKPFSEVVPTKDYLFRYDRGSFWMGMYAFQYFLLPFNAVTRWILDYFMHSRIMYHAMHASGHTDRYIIQDLALPALNASEFINFIDSRFGIYPLWLCPLPQNTRGSMAHPNSLAKSRNIAFQASSDGDDPSSDSSNSAEQYINVGVWGPYQSSYPEYVKANRDLEASVQKMGGLKWLYARAFYTEEEFWEIYDKRKYTALRQKYNASSLPTIYEKVREHSERDREENFYGQGLKGQVKRLVLSTAFMRAVYGIWKAIRGGDYLLKRKRE